MSSIIRLYFPDNIQSDLSSHLPKEQTHYVKDVMRLKIGDKLSIFNTLGEWSALIVSYEKNGAKIKIMGKVRDIDNENNIWLAFSPIKQNPMNFIIQKGTELGVQKFIPILAERTIVREINKPESLKNFLSTFPKNGCLVFGDINSNQKNLKNILEKKVDGPICILIGPEGDFSEKERKSIIDLNQTHSISLAKNILKAETAALSAITIVNHYLNLS